MFLIIISIITGWLGLVIGSTFGADSYMYFGGVVGVLSPALFVLQKIYLAIDEKES